MTNLDPVYQTAVALKSALFTPALREFLRTKNAEEVARAAGEQFEALPREEVESAIKLLMEMTYPAHSVKLIEVSVGTEAYLADAIRLRAHEFAKTYTQGPQQDMEYSSLKQAGNQLGIDFVLEQVGSLYRIKDLPNL